jgi:hypothetical protein
MPACPRSSIGSRLIPGINPSPLCGGTRAARFQAQLCQGLAIQVHPTSGEAGPLGATTSGAEPRLPAAELVPAHCARA